jgi:hypothetical protein
MEIITCPQSGKIFSLIAYDLLMEKWNSNPSTVECAGNNKNYPENALAALRRPAGPSSRNQHPSTHLRQPNEDEKVDDRTKQQQRVHVTRKGKPNT